MTSALESQKEQDADDELAQFSDDEDSQDEDENGKGEQQGDSTNGRKGAGKEEVRYACWCLIAVAAMPGDVYLFL